jgi:hypothetical protein
MGAAALPFTLELFSICVRRAGNRSFTQVDQHGDDPQQDG